MFVEVFDGGIIFREAMDKRVADRAGRIVTAFRRYSRSSFFKPPMNDALGSKSRVLKAWLADPYNEKTNPSICNDYLVDGDTETGWANCAAKELVRLTEHIDMVTATETRVSFVQSYPPGSLLIKHEDKGQASRIVGLTGEGTFCIYGDDGEVPKLEIVVGPCDVLHFTGIGLHDAINQSNNTYRETLNLIDVQ